MAPVSGRSRLNSKRSPKRCETPAARSRPSASRVVPPAKREHRSQHLRPLPTGRGDLADRAAARHTKVSPPRWQGSTTPPTRRGWPRDAATRPGGRSRHCPHAPVRLIAMTDEPTPAGVGPLPRGLVGWRLARMRAFLRRRRLDAALARGADPWSAGELMVRAARLSSLSERQTVASGSRRWWRSRSISDRHRRTSRFGMRWSSSSGNRCLHSPSESVRRRLSRWPSSRSSWLLLTDSSSPVFAGGNDPDGLAEATSRCLHRVSEDLAPD